MSRDDEDSEICVEQLAEGSPALESGLKMGDTLLKVGETAIHRFADLRDASFFLTADENVPISVEREGKSLLFSVRAADPPGESMSLPPTHGNEPGLTLPLPGEVIHR